MLIAFCITVTGQAYADGRECGVYVTLAPCQYEDSANCYWDASTRGNGNGNSFVDINGHLWTWEREQ